MSPVSGTLYKTRLLRYPALYATFVNSLEKRLKRIQLYFKKLAAIKEHEYVKSSRLSTLTELDTCSYVKGKVNNK